jgi:hypothetical protein
MPPTRFELPISAGERPQAYALDGAATGSGIFPFRQYKISKASPPNFNIEVLWQFPATYVAVKDTQPT